MQVVILLYLFDNDTSFVVLLSSVLGTGIELWKASAGRRGVGFGEGGGGAKRPSMLMHPGFLGGWGGWVHPGFGGGGAKRPSMFMCMHPAPAGGIKAKQLQRRCRLGHRAVEGKR